MSLPHEEIRALKKSRTFLGSLLMATFSWHYFARLALSKKMRLRLRDEIYYCIKHYPLVVDKLFENTLCSECGDTKWFCKCEKGKR